MSIEDKIYNTVLETLDDLSGKCFAITGCTTGTGFWTAIAAVRKGASCILLLNRKSSRAEEAEKLIKAEEGNTKVVTVDCDLQSLASVRNAASQVSTLAAEFGGLDGLINNAGIMAVPDTRTVDGLDVQMQTNHLSHFLLTKLLMPALNAAAAVRGEARVVQHSSGARMNRSKEKDGNLESPYFVVCEPGSLGGDSTPECFMRYHQTKLANTVFTMALHHKLSSVGSKVKSLCADPGVAATSLAANMTAQHAKAKEVPREQKAKTAKSSEPRPSPTGMIFKPQSAADGACPLMEASFGQSASSGDFFMPGLLIENTPVGMPVKCMTAGLPTPVDESMRKRFNNEELTMNAANHKLLWEASEKVTEIFDVGKLSRL